MRTVIRLAAAIIVAVLVVVAGVLVLSGGIGGPDNEKGTVSKDSQLPTVAAVDRRDETGLETVRGYLRGALACDAQGDRLMSELSKKGETRAATELAGVCRTGAQWGSEAKLRMRDITSGTTREWEVDFDGAGAPKDLVLRLRQWEPGWEVNGLGRASG